MNFNYQINHRKLWVDSLVGMTYGFMSTLIVGTFIQLLAIGQDNQFSTMINQINQILVFLTPFGIGAAIGIKRKLRIVEILALMIGVGIAGQSAFIPRFELNHIVWNPTIGFNLLKGPGDVLGAWIVSVFFLYFFSFWSWESFWEIWLIPLIGILLGVACAFSIIYLTTFITVLWKYVIYFTVNKYHWLAILLSPILGALMGLALSLPTSSAAIAFALHLQGDAATAAIAATSAQMLAFGILTFWATGNIGQTLAVTFGSSMLQISNFARKPKLLIIPTLCSALAALIATVVMPLAFEAQSVTAGMGTSLLYGQIFTLQENGWGNYRAWVNVIFIQIMIPIILALAMTILATSKNWIKKDELWLKR